MEMDSSRTDFSKYQVKCKCFSPEETLCKGFKWEDAPGIMELHVALLELISPLVLICLHILTGVKTKIQRTFYEVLKVLTLAGI